MHIVIVGAGYAGLHAVIALDQLLKGRDAPLQITLVERNPYHQLVQELHLAATTAAEPADAVVPLEQILGKRLAQTHQGSVAQIVPLQRQVCLADGQTLTYDRLLLTLGAETNYGNVPGSREHTFSLRTYDEALRLRAHIAACFQAASESRDVSERRTLLTFAIVGGGYTGCQLAGELAVWTEALAQTHGIDRDEVRLMLVERGDLLLRQFGRWATRHAEYTLRRRGVQVLLSTSVERVAERELVVSDGQTLHAATIVWAGGIRAPALLAESGLPVDGSGRVYVDRYLRVQDQALIFAAGDCAHIPDSASGAVPSTASYALRQGEHLARTLLDEATGRAPRMYMPLRLGEVVSLGPGEAIGNPLGAPLAGPPAALLKKAIEGWYRTTLW